MKKILFAVMLLAGAMTAQADDYAYLTLQTADGTSRSLSVESLVLTVADGKLVATNSEGTAEFSLSDLNKMYFTTSASDVITGIEADRAPAGPVQVYTMGGVLLGTYDSAAAARQALSPGVYVMKGRTGVQKTAVR